MGLFRYILGGEDRRNLRKIDAIADSVLALEPKYVNLTDEELVEIKKADNSKTLLESVKNYNKQDLIYQKIQNLSASRPVFLRKICTNPTFSAFC